MRKFLIFIMIMFYSLTLSACDQFGLIEESDIPIIESIEVMYLGTDTLSTIDDFSLDLYQIVVSFDDGSTKNVILNDTMISSSDLDKLGDIGVHQIEVFYEGFRASFEVHLISNEVPLTDLEIVEKYKSKLTLVTDTLVDIVLPSASVDGAKFYWSSSDESIITNTGVVSRPLEDTIVTMTVTIVKADASVTKDFLVTVFGEVVTLEDIIYYDLDTIVSFTGVVSNTFRGGYFLTDGTNAIAVFNKDVSNPLYPSIGDEVSVEGTLSNYYSLFQIKNPTTEVINSSDNVVGLLPTVSTIEDILSLDSTNRLIHGKQYTISGTISIEGDFSNVYINNGNSKILIAYYSPTTSIESLEAQVGNEVTITVFYYANHPSNGVMVGYDNIYAESVLDCDVSPSHPDCLTSEYINIFYLNDLHGAILPDGNTIGLSYIANLITTTKNLHPNNTLILAGGDMLQGSALSNYYNGLSTINIMNEMKFDAFTIGNHEFDWGIDTITDYSDGDLTNGEADFPFLGANIIETATGLLPDGILPYTIIDKGNIRIGIIGTIGYGLESSIATSKTEGLEFLDPIPIIKEYTHHLRTSEGCDIILVVSHDSGNINDALDDLNGDYKVDAIFNAHSHRNYYKVVSNTAIIQSQAKGTVIGKVTIEMNNDSFLSVSATNLSFDSDVLLQTTYTPVETLIQGYLLETASIFYERIFTSEDYISSNELTVWISKLITIASGSDITFHNYGGTRTSIAANDDINVALLYELWPFDNIIKSVELTGLEIKSILSSSSGSLGHYTELSYFEDDVYYTVATNDYVFDKPENPYIYGLNPTNTGIVLRDLALNEMELQALIYTTFRLDNQIQTTNE